MSKVKISDYEQQKHESLIAINMVGIHIDYVTLDLIWEIMEIHHNKGGQVNIEDCVKIKVKHEEKWQKYFDEQNNTKRVNNERQDNKH
jgi:hypothetical protein